MNSSHSSQTQPLSRGSTVTRRLASRVLSLIDKYESLSISGTSHQTPPLQQPTSSAFHRLGKSVLARARLFVENAADKTRSNQRLEKIAPPKRRFLKFSRRKRKHRTTDNGSNGFDYDGTISSNSTAIDTDSSLAASTPPVARILPSSFFSQLASSNEQNQTSGKLNTRAKWRRRRMTQQSSAARGLRMGVGKKESTFSEIRRRLMPPKVSVRDLAERFQEAERAYNLSPTGANKPSKFMMHDQLTSKETKLSSRGFLRGCLKPRDADRSFGGLLEDQSSGYPDVYDDYFYEATRKDSLKDSTITFAPPQLMCRDDMNYLNTNFQYMADGSLSNFGYFLLRLESEAGTPKAESETETPNASTFFTAPTHLNSQEPATAKVYRKTPPPSGFFFNPENSKIGGKARDQKKGGFYTTRPLKIINIASPIPMNAVQAAQLRGMVFRYT